MEWTNQRPTVSGYYWSRKPYYDDEVKVDIVYVDLSIEDSGRRGCVRATYTDIELRMNQFTYWYGPLDAPRFP